MPEYTPLDPNSENLAEEFADVVGEVKEALGTFAKAVDNNPYLSMIPTRLINHLSRLYESNVGKLEEKLSPKCFTSFIVIDY